MLEIFHFSDNIPYRANRFFQNMLGSLRVLLNILKMEAFSRAMK